MITQRNARWFVPVLTSPLPRSNEQPALRLSHRPRSCWCWMDPALGLGSSNLALEGCSIGEFGQDSFGKQQYHGFRFVFLSFSSTNSRAAPGKAARAFHVRRKIW